MKVLTADQMREVDGLTIERGTPGEVLMENAGRSVGWPPRKGKRHGDHGRKRAAAHPRRNVNAFVQRNRFPISANNHLQGTGV